jgi:hypothetical protein
MPQPRVLQAAWVCDERRHRADNAHGRNHWHVYTDEILNRLGLTARVLAPEALGDPTALAPYSLLVVGQAPAQGWPSGTGACLQAWVKQGGILIGFATNGLDGLFGIETCGELQQLEGPFSITGYLRLREGPLAAGIRPASHAAQPLIIISPVRLVVPTEARPVASLLTPDPAEPGRGRAAHETPHAAITQRVLGAGRAIFFAFDVAQAMWTIHQGRPVDRDHDGDGYLRSMDARVIADNDPGMPHTDVLHLLLQSIVGCQPLPLVHQIPPVGGEVADALFFFGGDDEGQPHHQLAASSFMRSRGLPYHINLMAVDGQFALGPGEIEQIRRNGHELSLHYDFITGYAHPTGFAQEDVRRQAEAFRRVFGRPPVCSVNHWCRWTGGCEPARWMRDEGQIADNSWFGARSDVLNPVNTVDFSFGSAFPRRLWDDWRRGNEVLRFVQEPIVAYEVGYRGDQTDFPRLHDAVDLALQYHLTMNLFYHPVYIATSATCQQALDELLRYLGARGARACFVGNDALAQWWLTRSEARVEDVQLSADGLHFEASCEHPDGFVVKVCLGAGEAGTCAASSCATDVCVVQEFGGNWAYVALPPGRHQVRLTVRR